MKSQDFDSEAVEHLNKKQKEIDNLLSNRKNIELTAKAKLKMSSNPGFLTYSMRDNLIFYSNPEQREGTDDDFLQKILACIEDNLKMQTARTCVHRAHRIGRFNPSKIWPIIAKFAFFPDMKWAGKAPGY